MQRGVIEITMRVDDKKAFAEWTRLRSRMKSLKRRLNKKHGDRK